MTKLMDRIAENDRRAGLAATWLPIIKAAGFFDDPEFQIIPEDAVVLGGRLMRDKEIAQICQQPEFAIPCGGCVVDYDVAGAIESLDDEGRAALRARISFVTTPTIRGVARRG